MPAQSTVSRQSRKYLLKVNNMDQPEDRDERKREYNRLAQREFRRRRKEHLKNLEQAQKEQNSEQSEEIERLRYENDELRRENESLRAQLYGSPSSSSSQGLLSTSMNVPPMPYDNRTYSLSPSVSGSSLSGAGSPQSLLAQDMLPLTGMQMTTSMMTPSLQAYDSSVLSSQPYSMVHPSGIRQNSLSSQEISGFRSSRSLGSSFQSMSISPASESSGSTDHTQRRPSGQGSALTPYDRNRARSELLALFHPYYSDISITTSPDAHLAALNSLSQTLPNPLKPNKAHLDTPHYYGIDMIASPALRDRLLTVSSDVAQNFMVEVGFIEGDIHGQLTIWGDDPLNEMAWEFSQQILERWQWLLGREWVKKSNWWRRQRGVALIPEW